MKNIVCRRNLFPLAILLLPACGSSGTKTCAYPGLVPGKQYSYIYVYEGETHYEFSPDVNGEGEITNVPNDVNCAETGVGELIWM